MATKKQSTRSEDSGWLLEVGVIGIDKTLKFMRFFRHDLLEVEWLRNWHTKGLTFEEKKTLPWIKLKLNLWDNDPEAKRMIELQRKLKPWPDYLKDEELKKGRKLTDDEFYDLGADWNLIASWYPWQEMTDLTEHGFDEDELLKKRKGNKERNVFYRKNLRKYLMDRETFELIKSGAQGTRYSGFNYNKFNRIKAESLILWDAIQVLNGKLKSMPESYSDVITQKYYNQKSRDKVTQIIYKSLELSKSRKSRMVRQLQELKGSLKKHDQERISLLKRHEEKRIDLVSRMALLSLELKKWGRKPL